MAADAQIQQSPGQGRRPRSGQQSFRVVEVAVNGMEARVDFQPFAGGADRVLVPVDAVQCGRAAGQVQNALAVAAAAQRAVGIYAVGAGLHPLHHFVKQDGNMMKFHGYSLFAPG